MARARSKRGLPNRTSGSRWKESNYRCSQERCLAFVSPAQASRLSSETLAGRTKGAHLEGPRRRTRGYTVVALRLDDTDSNFCRKWFGERRGGGGASSPRACSAYRGSRATTNALSPLDLVSPLARRGGHVGWSFSDHTSWTSPPPPPARPVSGAAVKGPFGDVALPHTGAAPHTQGSGNSNAQGKAHAGRARARAVPLALRARDRAPRLRRATASWDRAGARLGLEHLVDHAVVDRPGRRH